MPETGTAKTVTKRAAGRPAELPDLRADRGDQADVQMFCGGRGFLVLASWPETAGANIGTGASAAINGQFGLGV